MANLLVVDDDDFFRSMTQETLEESGYTVDTAEDGLAAWEKIDRAPAQFDLMLLDKQMPRQDGISLLKRIKADARLKELPVVMLTGDNRQQDIIEGLAAGASYYLIKPSSEDVLLLVIKNALDEFRKKRELRELVGKHESSLSLLRRADYSFRTLTEANDLALLLADASMNPARTVNGYAELLINAVEHGNLGITYFEKGQLIMAGCWEEEVASRLKDPRFAHRYVDVTLERTPVASIVAITDQGQGFNWQNYVEFSPERVFDLHGRGIAMSKAISFDSLEYCGNGNKVIATVRYPAQQ
jgi:CheY-like chemotaxis protein